VSRLRVFLSRLFGVSNGRNRDADLRTEIDAHIDEAEEDYIRQGLSRRSMMQGQFGAAP
jgi:hypothetical protein